jgi:uncharacterized protein DUF6745
MAIVRKTPGIALPRTTRAPVTTRTPVVARSAEPGAAPEPETAPDPVARNPAQAAARAARRAERSPVPPGGGPTAGATNPAQAAFRALRPASSAAPVSPSPRAPAGLLTSTHRVTLGSIGDMWADVVSATGPADRPAAEAAVRAAYRAAGLAEPERVVWYQSPLAAAVAATVASGAARPADLARTRLSVKVPGRPGRSVHARLHTALWEGAKAEATARLGAAGWAQAWDEGAARLWEPTRELTERIRDAVRAGVGASDDTVRTPAAGAGHRQLGDRVRAVTHDALGGQHDAAWLAVFDGLRECFPDFAFPGLAELGEVARHIGWWWPYERVALLSERPSELYRDDHSRLHNGDGPALTYADGFALHAWRGMPVPADFVGGLGPGGSRLDVRRINDEENAELRRVMLEIYGYDRYLREVGAQPLDQDETGVLWEIELPDDEPIVMVEVLNSTPEPDGTTRTYWLRVPPHISSAREGVAWTFGISAHDYRPLEET